MFATEEQPATPATVASYSPATSARRKLAGVLSTFLRARLTRPTAWQLIAWSFATLSTLALFSMALDAGITLDEQVHVRYGEEILAWLTSDFTDERALHCSQRLYAGLFDVLGAALNASKLLPLDTYSVVHLLSALFALCATWATWRMAALIGGKPAGFLAASFLMLTPSFVGHAIFNPKDIPFATGATLTLYAAVCIGIDPRPLSWKNALRAGLCLGIGLATRSGGLFLLVYPLVAAIASSVISLWWGPSLIAARGLVRGASLTVLKLCVGFALAWTVMIAAWPWAQQQPFSRPFEAAREAANFQWRNKLLFDGERIFSYELPWTYLPTWFGITMPELYLVALVCVGVCGYVLWRKRVFDARRVLCVGLIVASVALPLLGVLVARPIIYDAHRHFVFFFPALAALAGLATARVLTDVSLALPLRGSLTTALVALAGLCVFDMHALHPYQYIYFNRIFGGLPAAQGRFETDYWGAANREAFLWVFENHRSKKTTRIAACYMSGVLDMLAPHWPDAARFKHAKREKHAQVFIATTRDNCHLGQRGRVIHTVERNGVPLAYVFQR
jgi:hypothetical protein